MSQLQKRTVEFSDLEVDGDDTLLRRDKIVWSCIHYENPSIQMKPSLACLSKVGRNVYESALQKILPYGCFSRVISRNDSLRNHKETIFIQSLNGNLSRKHLFHEGVAD